MATVENLKNSLIEKILAIRNEDFLVALDSLIESSHLVDDRILLTKAQKEMLQMSDLDILNGDLTSQEALDKQDLEWLNEK